MDVSVTDFQKQLARAGDITGGFTTSLAPNVSPTLELGPGSVLPTNQDQRWSAHPVIAADATHNGYAAVINSNPGLLVVEKIRAHNANAANTWLLYFLTGAVVNGLNPANNVAISLDGRNGYAPNGSIRGGPFVSQANNANVPGGALNIDRVQLASNSDGDFIVLPIVLLPGEALIVSVGTVNLTYSATFYFREYEFRPT